MKMLFDKYFLRFRIPKNSVIIFSFITFLAYVIATNILKQNAYIWLLLTGSALGIFIIKYHKAGLVLVFVSLFLLDWLSDVIGLIPRQVTWVPEVILIILLLKILFISATEKKFLRTPIDYLVLCLIILGIISAFVNYSKFIVTFAGFRNYFKFYLLFYVTAFLDYDDQFLKKLLKFLILLAFIQIPITILQKYLYIGQSSGDPIGGTLGVGTSGTLTLFLLMIISILIAFYMNKLITGRKLLYSIAFLFIPMSINETKITYFLFPALVLFLLGKNFIEKKEFKSFITLAIISGMVFIVSYQTYKSIYIKRRNIEVLSYGYVSRYIGSEYTKSGGLNRLAQVKFANKNITQQFNTTMLGVGPGNASDSFFEDAIGYYYRKYSLLNIDSVFLSRFLWEYGYLGIAVFLCILFNLFRLAGKIYKYSSVPFYKSIALSFVGMMFVLIGASIYSNSFLIDVLGYAFWFMAGCIHRIHAQFELENSQGF